MVAVWQPWLPMSYDYFSSNIVDIIQENSNTTRHTLYFDNFFNNYEPLVKSSGWKMRAIGTIRPYRSNGADAVILPLRAPSTYGPELAPVRTNSDTKSGIRTTGALPKMQRVTTRGARKAIL
ncbi:conserved hypothetical protein [Trichinella spiralis]|uniref:hypothetical protein n=1 Tax=Trichinella spiralis TaxID=6334 RepID=UPI0001EFDDA9|nr:conserved hypothetical protein [Trichinella spiralis]